MVRLCLLGQAGCRSPAFIDSIILAGVESARRAAALLKKSRHASEVGLSANVKSFRAM
jgi:hypothetical protein